MNFGKLFYKGKDVLEDDNIPNGETWFITKRFFVIKKVRDDKTLNVFQRYWIYLKTKFYELTGR